MHRFYLPPEQCAEPALHLGGREAHHGLNVLRLRRGESVVVLDGSGHEYTCEVSDVAKGGVQLAVREKKFIPPNPWRITLVQAIPKGKVFDSIVQKAAELGAYSVVPLLTERVVIQLDEERSDHKVSHWRTTAVEAIKQCGSAWLSRVEAPVSLKDFAAKAQPFDLALIASLQPGSRHPRDWFQEFQTNQGRVPQSLVVWVGPEGDFTPEEVATIEATGARPITLGRWVLRSETAAVYCLSVLNYELQMLTANAGLG